MTFIIGTPHTHNAGYFRNDDRPAGGKLSEADVQTCAHCQAVIKMQDWREDGGWCGKEQKPICNFCADRALVYGCEPFLKKLEEYTDSLVKYQQYLRIAGLEPSAPPQSIITV